MTGDNCRFDPNALRITMENMFIKKMMDISNMPPEQRKTVEDMVRIFAKHNIGAIEAMEIVTELTEVLSADSQ
ncbi:MAG: hypothetical protein RR382_00850 [Tannerellaceae bacterium]